MTIQTILNLPLFIALIIFVLFAVLLGFAAYFFVRSIIQTPVPAEVKGTADSIFRISGALLGLLLSLTFVDIRQELLKIRDSVELEAGQLTDINGFMMLLVFSNTLLIINRSRDLSLEFWENWRPNIGATLKAQFINHLAFH